MNIQNTDDLNTKKYLIKKSFFSKKIDLNFMLIFELIYI